MDNVANENWPVGKIYGDYYAYDIDNELIYLVDEDGNIKGLPTPVTIWLNKKGFIENNKYGEEVYVTENEDYLWVFDPDRAFVVEGRVPGAHKINDALLADLAYMQDDEFYSSEESTNDDADADQEEIKTVSKKRKTKSKVVKTTNNPTVPLMLGGVSLAGLLLLLSHKNTTKNVIAGPPLPAPKPVNITEDIDILLGALQSAANSKEPPAYLKPQISQLTKIFLDAAGAVPKQEVNINKVVYTICQDPVVSQFIPNKNYDFARSVVYILHTSDNIKPNLDAYLIILLDINQKIDIYITEKIYLVLTSLLNAAPYINESVNQTGQALIQEPNQQTYTDHIKALVELFDNSEDVNRYINSINYSIISPKVIQDVAKKYKNTLQQNSHKKDEIGGNKSFGNGVVIKRNV